MSSPMATNPSSMLTPVSVQLPEEIIVEILNRLPVQTLVEFKCVCKLWNRLITDPIFVNTHLHFNSPTRIILSRNYKPPLSIPLNPNPSPQQYLHLPRSINGHTYYCIKGHCNGLLCLIQGPTIILYNPSLSRSRTLPTPSKFYQTRDVLGIGYDSSVNDYKIVRVPSFYCKSRYNDYKPKIEVLSLNSNSWRELPETETPPYSMQHEYQSLYLNGGIYWRAVENNAFLIVRFDVSKERFSIVPLPPDDHVSWIGVINHSLCAAFTHLPQNYFDIWETQDDLNWKKLITVSKFADPRPYYWGHLNHYPLCFIETGELLIIVPDMGLMAYDPKKHWYRRFALMNYARDLQVAVYTDSLVFPHEPLDQTGSSFDQARSSSDQTGSSFDQARSSLDQTGSSFAQAHSSLDQTGSSSNAFKKMLMQFSDAFRSHFTCLSSSSKRL